jgi:hypothetical protein
VHNPEAMVEEVVAILRLYSEGRFAPDG